MDPRTDQLQRWLGRLKYKPNFGFSITNAQLGNDGIKYYMYMEAWVIDSRKPSALKQLATADYNFVTDSPLSWMYAPENDVRVEGRTIKVSATLSIPSFLKTFDEFTDWWIRKIHEFEKHEMYEWARVDGELRWDPHA